MKRSIPLYKSLTFKITLLAAIILLIIVIALIYSANQNQQAIIRMKQEDLNQIAVDTVDRRFKVSYELLETSLAQISLSPAISQALALADAEALTGLVLESFDKLKKVGIDEFHFYLPDNRSLLSLYDEPDKTITPCRPEMVIDINADPNHLPIKGVEECQHGVFIRYITPIYNDNIYLGSVELGMEIENRILTIFKNVSGGEWYLYALDENTLLEGTSPVDHHPLEITEALALSLAQGQVFTSESPPYLTQLIPIDDYQGDYSYYFKRVFDNSDLLALQRGYTRKYLIYGIMAALVGIFLLWLAMAYLLKPLLYLEQRVRQLELGDLGQAIAVKSDDEIGYLAGAMENMRQSLSQREAALKEQSYRDPLTRAHNRLALDQQLAQIVEKELFPTTLIMADIDNLKQINDQDGHGAGDTHIIKCAQVIRRALRDSDAFFRIGGDEFILLFPQTDEQTGVFILKRIKEEIDAYNQTRKVEESFLSVSFGIGVCQGESACLDHAMAVADQKMYEEKALKKKQGKL